MAFAQLATPTSSLPYWPPPTAIATPATGGAADAGPSWVSGETAAAVYPWAGGLRATVAVNFATDGFRTYQYNEATGDWDYIAGGYLPNVWHGGVLSDPAVAAKVEYYTDGSIAGAKIFITKMVNYYNASAPSKTVYGIGGWVSTNGGTSWYPMEEVFNAPFGLFADHPWLAVSKLPSTNNAALTWLAWRNLPFVKNYTGPAYKQFCLAATGNTSSWGYIGPMNASTCFSPEPQTGGMYYLAPIGLKSVIVVWPVYRGLHMSRCTFATSLSCTTPTEITHGLWRGAAGDIASLSVRASGGPSVTADETTGEVVVLWSQRLDYPNTGPGGQSDTWWIHSTDYGATWTSPVSIWPQGYPGFNQLQPAVAAEGNGKFIATFYGATNDPSWWVVNSIEYRNGGWDPGSVTVLSEPFATTGFWGDYSATACNIGSLVLGLDTCLAAYTVVSGTSSLVEVTDPPDPYETPSGTPPPPTPVVVGVGGGCSIGPTGLGGLWLLLPAMLLYTLSLFGCGDGNSTNTAPTAIAPPATATVTATETATSTATATATAATLRTYSLIGSEGSGTMVVRLPVRSTDGNLWVYDLDSFQFDSVAAVSGTLEFLTAQNRVTIRVTTAAGDTYVGLADLINPDSTIPSGPYDITLRDDQGHTLTFTVQAVD